MYAKFTSFVAFLLLSISVLGGNDNTSNSKDSPWELMLLEQFDGATQQTAGCTENLHNELFHLSGNRHSVEHIKTNKGVRSVLAHSVNNWNYRFALHKEAGNIAAFSSRYLPTFQRFKLFESYLI